MTTSLSLKPFLDSLVAKNLESVLSHIQPLPVPVQLPAPEPGAPKRHQYAIAPPVGMEAQLVAAARQGDTSKLIEHVYALLPVHAWELVNSYRDRYGARVEVDDVIQVGALQMVRSTGKALKAANPISLLRHAAHMAMIRYCAEAISPIRVPYSTQWEHKIRPTFVESLDALLYDDSEKTLLDDRLTAEAVLL